MTARCFETVEILLRSLTFSRVLLISPNPGRSLAEGPRVESGPLVLLTSRDSVLFNTLKSFNGELTFLIFATV